MWADYLGIDLERAEDDTVRGTRPYTPDGPTGVTVNVSLLFRNGTTPLPPAGSSTARARAASCFMASASWAWWSRTAILMAAVGAGRAALR
ncbi:hypothetical protein ACIQPR_47585 [Streptomyces sp. NPDC091280]|uniref:hypothetical protein n=1 Tax=Streptomyces sp. NPDC091280 TaxID=3365984 RepID=UPI0037F97670